MEETLMETLNRIEETEEKKRGEKWQRMDGKEKSRIILRRWRKEKTAERRRYGMQMLLRVAGAVALIGLTAFMTLSPEPKKEMAREAESYVVQALSAEMTIERPWHVIESAKVYHYCACKKCCGKTEGDPAYGVTRSGTVATAGRTIAVDPEIIPLGAEVVIDGKTYIAEDTGGAIKGYTVDVYCESHAEALKKGVYQTEIKWREGEKQ